MAQESVRIQVAVFEKEAFLQYNFSFLMTHPFLGSPGQWDGAFDRGPAAAGTGKSQGGRQVGRNRQCEAGTGTG